MRATTEADMRRKRRAEVLDKIPVLAITGASGNKNLIKLNNLKY